MPEGITVWAAKSLGRGIRSASMRTGVKDLVTRAARCSRCSDARGRNSAAMQANDAEITGSIIRDLITTSDGRSRGAWS
jgi:hypothetical protein